jgi:hypothetical protein
MFALLRQSAFIDFRRTSANIFNSCNYDRDSDNSSKMTLSRERPFESDKETDNETFDTDVDLYSS